VGETAASGVGRGQRVDHGVGRMTAVAGVRGARQAAERAARERLAGTLIGAAGELEVAVAQRAAAAGVIAARERAAAHVRRAQAEAERMVADAAAEVAVAEEQHDRTRQAATKGRLVLGRAGGPGLPPQLGELWRARSGRDPPNRTFPAAVGRRDPAHPPMAALH
jgi:hypothetical protein